MPSNEDLRRSSQWLSEVRIQLQSLSAAYHPGKDERMVCFPLYTTTASVNRANISSSGHGVGKGAMLMHWAHLPLSWL